MQVQAPVGRVAVQVERDSHEGDLHHHERHDHQLPKAKIQEFHTENRRSLWVPAHRSGATVRIKEIEVGGL